MYAYVVYNFNPNLDYHNTLSSILIVIARNKMKEEK